MLYVLLSGAPKCLFSTHYHHRNVRRWLGKQSCLFLLVPLQNKIKIYPSHFLSDVKLCHLRSEILNFTHQSNGAPFTVHMSTFVLVLCPTEGFVIFFLEGGYIFSQPEDGKQKKIGMPLRTPKPYHTCNNRQDLLCYPDCWRLVTKLWKQWSSTAKYYTQNHVPAMC